MILPNKYIQEDEALIGQGIVVLKQLKMRSSLSSLWDRLKRKHNFDNFERFVLILDMLFILGLIDFENNKIGKVKS